MRLVFALLGVLSLAPAQDWFNQLKFRNIGPAIMGGRATDVEGVPGNPSIVYAATGGGGLFKSTNAGQTWTPIFEREATTLSIGDIALEPGNSEVIWVGTGESNVRNSVSFGDGVYRSTDGGKSWRHLGLASTERISRVLVHPTQPDTAWVGALGHAFAPHADRGVFMTTDAGRTWTKTLYLDAEHGVSDMDIDPENPNVLYAGLWKFERKPWTHVSGSKRGGVWRSADGGRTWNKLTKGLPELIGRIGVKVAPSNPKIVYVICESNEGTLYRSNDGGESFTLVTKQRDIVNRGFYYADMRVDPVDENRLYFLATDLFLSTDGGKTAKPTAAKIHSDHHALWIDPKNPQRLWLGQDGGFAVSYDRGANWQYVNNLPLAQFYQIHANNRSPFYDIMGGLQDNGSWVGPARNMESGGIYNDDWRMVSFGDGFFIISHPDDPDLYLTESQGGYLLRANFKTREQQMVSPQPRSNSGGPASGMKYRFNWNTPIVPSNHDKNTVYFGGNVLFRTQDFGQTWKAISPDLTTNNPEKQKSAGGPIWYDNSTAENNNTIVTVSESPVRPGTIYIGTDDGNVQLTTDGAESWTNLTARFPDMAPGSVVSHVEASRREAQVAYVSFDRHMFDDFQPYLFRTVDGGRTFESIVNNLPKTSYIHVIKEDPRNPDLLWLGTETGLFASWNKGLQWQRVQLENLPKVAIHDIIVHPRDNDLILGTHGRSLYVFDDAAPLQQMAPAIAQKPAHLFPVRDAWRHSTRFTRYGLGYGIYTGPNPPYGALISFWAKDKGEPKIEILDAQGKVIRKLAKLPATAGLHRVAWDLRAEAADARKAATATPGGGDDEDGPARGPQVLPGTYTVRLTQGTTVEEQKLTIKLAPDITTPIADLQAQAGYTARLRDMVSQVNRSLKAVDSLKAQLDNAEKTAAAADVKFDLAPFRKQLKDAESMLARPSDAPRLEAPPGLAENLAALMSGIDGVNAKPTPYQIEVFETYRQELEQKLPAAQAILKQSAQWSDQLRNAGLAALVLPRL